jgi:hypothetical protein
MDPLKGVERSTLHAVHVGLLVVLQEQTNDPLGSRGTCSVVSGQNRSSVG